MSIKHALVVDDSRLAQITLKKQLEEHDLVVALAASGEEALEFLEHETVDVIFLDHFMPGMDGLQALAAIKKNPRTAMIPVMMYTTKEGEVYVGQARALGGIGVLPKEVPPNVLFDMLKNLGLVKDKRVASQPEADAPRRRATDTPSPESPPRETPTGMALATLVNRIMQDQAALRAELRKDRAGLASAVASEVIEAQRAERRAGEASPPARPSRIWLALTVIFGIAAVLFATTQWRDWTWSDRYEPASAPQEGTEAKEKRVLAAELHNERSAAQARYLKAIDALQWTLNQQSWLPFDALPFDDARAEQLRGLLEHLLTIGFRGRVRIESHLGEFCLVSDAAGGFRLAPPDLPVEACTRLGHPLDDSSFVADRESVGFAEFSKSRLATDSGITIELVAHDRAHSLAQVPFDPDISRAGEWNATAERNNRLEFSLIPAGELPQ